MSTQSWVGGLANAASGIFNSFIYGNIELQVSTEELLAKATEVESLINQMQTHFNDLTGYIDGTKNYWIGDGGDAQRKQYYDIKDNIEEIIKRLKEHPVDLETIAAQYVSTEQQTTQAAQALSGDAIS